MYTRLLIEQDDDQFFAAMPIIVAAAGGDGERGDSGSNCSSSSSSRMEQVLEVLGETAWDGPIEQVKAVCREQQVQMGSGVVKINGIIALRDKLLS